MDVVSDVASALFGGVWRLLLETEFPGIGVSVAGVAVALVLIRFSIRIFGFLTGFGISGGDYGRASEAIDKAKVAYDKKKAQDFAKRYM